MGWFSESIVTRPGPTAVPHIGAPAAAVAPILESTASIDMARPTTMQVRVYRGHYLELRDDGGTGWTVRVFPPSSRGGTPEVLRNRMPNGLDGLLAEARRRVDRRLDGAPRDAPRGR